MVVVHFIIHRYCGLRKPSWSELRHYVYFLSNQLIKIQNSPYTWPDSADDLPGFRKFVTAFMFRMAEVCVLQIEILRLAMIAINT